MTGKVKWFDEKRGYGFITGEGERDAFVHHSSILMDGYRCLEEGQAVVYDLEETDKGLMAINVKVLQKEA